MTDPYRLTFLIVTVVVALGVAWGFLGCLANDLDEYLGLRIPWLVEATVTAIDDDAPGWAMPFKAVLGLLIGLGAIVYLFARLAVLGGLFTVATLAIPAGVWWVGSRLGWWG